MKLKEFRELINEIPVDIYGDVEVSIICRSKEYLIKDEDNIEWYADDMDNDKLKIDITVS